MIKIHLVLRSKLKTLIGEDEIVIRLKAGSDIGCLVRELGDRFGEDVRNTLFSEKYGVICLCVRNRKRVKPDEVLEDGDKVMLLPPLAGG